MRTSKPVTVTLGKQQNSLDARLASGRYDSASEVMRAALRALDREDEALNAVMKARIQEALDDPRPSIAAEDVFDRIERRHAERMKASNRRV
jgi:antitoxin ParD1/3/4